QETKIRAALNAYRSGRVSSIKQAARDYDISFSTLQGRTKGRQSQSKGHESQKHLTEAEETSLVEWCLTESKKGS
ncbi:hypothetical protein M422DRAFT_116758, partial [Sphaerobolus stellatus SS14]